MIALKDGVDGLLGKLLGQEADEPNNGEAADHSDGTAVDGVNGITSKHVDDRETYAPDKAGPDRACGDTTPVEAQHERSQESTS